MSALYDSIGVNYAELRRPDPRIAEAIERGLGEAHTVLNVGAGTGSYEPADRVLIAVEPSRSMIRKRSASAPAAIQAVAEALPFKDNAFDASMAILTVHHWPDKAAGLRRLRTDLESGEWQRRYSRLLDRDEYDAGYRLVVAA